MGFLDFLDALDPDSENNPINKVKNAVVHGIDSVDAAVNAGSSALENGLGKAEQAATGLQAAGEKAVEGINQVENKLSK